MPGPSQASFPKSMLNLQRQVAVGVLALIAVLVTVTGLRHLLHREIALKAQDTLEVCVPRSTAAGGLSLHLAQCQSAVNQLEELADRPAAGDRLVRVWQSSFDKFSDSLSQLERLPSDEVLSKTLAAWRTKSDLYRNRFLEAASQRTGTTSGGLRQPALPDAAAAESSLRVAQSDAAARQRAAQKRLSECLALGNELTDEVDGFAAVAAQQARDGEQQLLVMVGRSSRLTNAQAIAMLVSLCLVTAWFSRTVLSRLRVLSVAMERLKKGDLQVRVAAGSRDEIGAMAVQLNDLATTLQNSHELAGKAASDHEAARLDKSGLLARIGREFRGPLSTCTSFLEELLQSPDRTEVREIALLLRQNVDRLWELSGCLLDVAHFESGEAVLKPVQCSPCELIKEASTIATGRAAAKGRRLNIEYAGAMPESISADATRLKQMLLQLLDGACELIPAGSLRMIVRLHAAKGPQPMLQFDVAALEQGPSRDGAHHSSERPEFPGPANLALDLAGRIARILGGTARMVGDPAQGGALCVTIPTGPLAGVPLFEPDALALGADPAPARRAQTCLGCRVLVAEDGPENRRFLALVLRKAGATVALAENGEQAMQIAASPGAEGPFDVILMDMQMPVVDGYEATRRLRQAGYAGQIIAITAHTDAYDKSMCLQAGCDRYLPKPVDRETLLAAVTESLRASSARSPALA